MQRKRRFRGGGTSELSILRRELREGSLQSILGGSSRLVPSSTSDPDPLLSSFIHNTPLANEILDVQPFSSIKQSSKKESTLENSSERYGASLLLFLFLFLSSSQMPIPMCITLVPWSFLIFVSLIVCLCGKPD